jgi:hypothetical protein
MGEALTPEQALRAHTINAAAAAFEDESKGSITPGKLADLVVLSADPLSVSPEEIDDIDTLLTMIGGTVEACAAGWERICQGLPSTSPSPRLNLAAQANVSASSELPAAPATNVIDGTSMHWNAAAISPQWIQLILSGPSAVGEIRLVVAQDPAGPSIHELWLGRVGHPIERVHVFEGVTGDGDVLRYSPPAPIDDVEVVRVLTTGLGELYPAWREIEILSSR